MIFIDIFCALNGKYSTLYIKGRREGEGGKKEEEEEEETDLSTLTVPP